MIRKDIRKITAFVKALAKFSVIVSAVVALLFIGTGLLILLFPQFIWKALTYIVGGGMLLLGLTAVGCLFYVYINRG